MLWGQEGAAEPNAQARSQSQGQPTMVAFIGGGGNLSAIPTGCYICSSDATSPPRSCPTPSRAVDGVDCWCHSLFVLREPAAVM